VGGHDRLSGVQGAQDEGAGRFHPTHQLDDQPDVGVVDHLLGAIGGIARRERALLVQVPDRDLDQLQVEARLRRDHVAFGEKLVSEAAADDAATEDSDTYAHGRKTVVLRHSAPEPAPGTLEVSTRSRSSGDRALVSGTRCAGSSPAGSTQRTRLEPWPKESRAGVRALSAFAAQVSASALTSGSSSISNGRAFSTRSSLPSSVKTLVKNA